MGPSSLLAQTSTMRFPPVQPSSAQFRGVFNRLSAVGTFNYSVSGEGVELTTPAREDGERTRILLGRDSVRVEFDPTRKSVDFAAEELSVVLKEVAAEFRIPVFVHQIHVLRKVFPLAGKTDACSFLMRQVVQLAPDRLAGWKRPFSSVGLRFVFPPLQVNDLTAHELKLDCFPPDPAKLLAEDTASFLVPMPAGQWDALKANLKEASRFLDEYAGSLLRPKPAPGA